jgi:hypothetical protein
VPKKLLKAKSLFHYQIPAPGQRKTGLNNSIPTRDKHLSGKPYFSEANSIRHVSRAAFDCTVPVA